MKLFEVVHEDDDLLAINKPADLVCHPTKGDVYSSLVSRVRLHLGPDAQPQLINRLDRETSGLVLVAKKAESAREWRRLWELGGVSKVYVAAVHGHVGPDHGTLDFPLGKDERSPVAIKDCVKPGGAAAVTEYRVMARWVRDGMPFTRLEVRPRSGRKHQIRIHLSHIGHPIVGDKIYGPDEQIYLSFVEGRITDDQRRRLILGNHALHAGELQADCGGRSWHLEARPGEELLRFLEG